MKMKKTTTSSLSALLLTFVLTLTLAFAPTALAADAVKTLALAEDWQLTDDFDLDVPENTQLVIDGGGRFHIYEMPGKLANTGSGGTVGTVYLYNTHVYAASDAAESGSIAALSKTARTLSVPSPAKDAAALTLPAPDGYGVDIKSSSNTGVIAIDGSIAPSSSVVSVTLVLTVTDAAGNKADTGAISVAVPAKTQSGGSSSGGGGSSSTSETSKTTPSTNDSVSVSYTQSGGNVTVTLPDDKVVEIIENFGSVATIDLTGAANATSASLPTAALTKLAAAELDIALKLPQGEITLEAEAAASIAEQAGGSNVSVGLKSVSASSLNAAQKEAIGDAPVFDISISSGNKAITGFGGAAVKIVLPYTLKTGEEASGIIALYVDVTGNTEKLPTSYDAGAKKVTFSTTHLSLYAIAYDETTVSLPTPWVNPFADVKKSDWFYADVEYVSANSLFAGTNAVTFSPQTPMTRGMIVTVLGRLNDVDASDYTASSFDDVAAGQYYASYVEWAKQSGIVSGVGNNKFSPDADITRQDLAVIILRYAEFAKKQFPVTLQYAAFADEADITEYAKNAVQTLYCGRIVSGKLNNLFDPKGSATRAEVAAILHRFIEAVK